MKGAGPPLLVTGLNPLVPEVSGVVSTRPGRHRGLPTRRDGSITGPIVW